ncbi:hypothetical protein QQS21_007317 [Conoideocrella luteorostrata]|uniref:Rhodopsin domain-containing protein n=1 Tax=Conoideocrella luteorostrata TaxID=1105319 RepID=A0AAJ0FX46_9HYPO|nr:hypothetical protein QQS21_007317 [Conoideocrella luteorostrata]
MALTVGIITTVITVARLIFKRFFSTTQTFTVDDLVITIALILHISCTTINVAGLATHGLGRDIWTLAPEELRTFTFYLYIIEIHFFTEISLAKISLLLFYLNIFPEKRIRRLLWGTAILIAVFGLVSSVIAIFQCTPVDYFWTQYSGTSAGHCLNINAFAWSNASVHVATDIWMLGIPLSQIPKLKLHWKKKLAAAFMFMTGLFITVAATLRMQSLVHFANSDNPTWDQTIVCVWATIETNVSIICTCLPTMRLIVLRIFPKVFGSGTKRSKSYVTYESAQSNSSGKKSTGGYPVSETKSAADSSSV